jgi:hypothetical protein
MTEAMKTQLNNRLNNLQLELETIKQSYQGNKRTASTSLRQLLDKLLVYVAELAPQRLQKVSFIRSESKPNDYYEHFERDCQQLRIFVSDLRTDIDNGELDNQLNEIDSGYKHRQYNLTLTQKRLLRILVNLKQHDILREPVSADAIGGIPTLKMKRGRILQLFSKISDFKVEDLQTLVEEDFLSCSENGNGKTYGLRQSAFNVVEDNFIQNSSSPEAIMAIGSPYGFGRDDLSFVKDQRSRKNTLIVSFGHKFNSSTYSSQELISNIGKTLAKAIEEYNTQNPRSSVSLEFTTLGAGLGEHLFNNIARTIMGSDISIFETSDLNPNVMLEMGVALTWGVSVLPIRKSGKPEPPSDISGQTWQVYEENGSFDNAFQTRLAELIKRSIAKKRANL